MGGRVAPNRPTAAPKSERAPTRATKDEPKSVDQADRYVDHRCVHKNESTMLADAAYDRNCYT
jgi:hypothetical protein